MGRGPGDRGYKSPSSTWCLLRDSTEIHAAIQHKMKQKQLTLTKLSEISGIAKYRISMFLNRRKPNLTQFQIMSLAKILGIEINLTVKFTE